MSKLLKSRAEQEGRILLAILALKKNEFSSLRKAADIFNLSESTLRSYLKEVFFRGEQRANSYKITISEEKSLKE